MFVFVIVILTVQLVILWRISVYVLEMRDILSEIKKKGIIDPDGKE